MSHAAIVLMSLPLIVSFLFCKMEISIVPTSKSLGEDERS